MMKLKNNVSVRGLEHFDNEFDLAGIKSFECLKVDYVKPQKIVSSSPFCHGVLVQVSMSTSSQKTSMKKVADLHFLTLSSTRCGTHRPQPYQASSGSIRLPRWSLYDRVGLQFDFVFWVDAVFLHGPSAGAA